MESSSPEITADELRESPPGSPGVSGYEVVIEPNRSWLRFDWRPLWEFRDLLYLLVRREFLAKYKQTILGPAWFVLQPLLTTLIFVVVFWKIAAISTDQVPPVLFYLCGLLGWNYFAQNLNHTGATFVTHAQLFGKVYFPRLVVPFSMVASNVLAYVIQLGTFLAFYFYFAIFTPFGAHFVTAKLGWEIFLLPLIVLHTAALSLGVGLWVSALSAKYRDFTHILPLIIQLWMYATPVIFPASRVPPRFAWLMTWNPMAAIVEAHRAIFFNTPVDPRSYCISIVLTLLVLLSGMAHFQKVERTFIDTV